MSNHIVFTWGKFNPPHIGHEKIIKEIERRALELACDHYVFTSKSKTLDNHTDILKEAFGPNVISFRMFSDVINFIVDAEYESATMVIGSDRVPEFIRILDAFKRDMEHNVSFEVISGGDRKPGDDVEGMSSTKMRSWIAAGEIEPFIANLPSKLSNETKQMIVRKLQNTK